jgi:hypothetical protein
MMTKKDYNVSSMINGLSFDGICLPVNVKCGMSLLGLSPIVLSPSKVHIISAGLFPTYTELSEASRSN